MAPMEESGWFSGDALPPELYRTIQFEMFWRDLWFGAHPGAVEYRRPYAKGEFWPLDEDVDPKAVEYVSIRVAEFLGEDHGLLRMWSMHPPVLFGGGDGEDSVNWKVAAQEEGGVPADGPCPHCDAPAGVLFVEDGLNGTRFWLRCPDCRSLTPLPRREHA